MKDIIEFILKNYSEAAKENNQNHLGAKYVRDNLKKFIIKFGAIDEKKYLVKGSSGAGNIAEIPWLGIFDKNMTTGAQSGLYIVYLFRADLKGVYLSLNQGWTQFKNMYSNKKIALNNIKKVTYFIRKSINTDISNMNELDIDLNCKGDLGKGYESGHICGRYYQWDDIPNNKQLILDLNELMGIYREIIGFSGDQNYGDIIKLIIDNDNTQEFIAATKNLDFNEEIYQKNIQECEFTKTIDEPKEFNTNKTNTNLKQWKRDESIAKEAIVDSDFKCEIDENHKTFNTKKNNPYMEAHHLIPMSKQKYIKYSLDVKANIISLCPTCHRKLHYGSIEDNKIVLRSLFEIRKNRLHKCGIDIDFETLIEWYK